MAKKLNVLVACERYQETTKAFRDLGHNAWSIDLCSCKGPLPQFHICGDAVRHLLDHGLEYDLIIAHPPCTYLSKASTPVLFAGGIVNRDRLPEVFSGLSFFLFFYHYAQITHIPFVIENPVPLRMLNLPKPSQVIQPYFFGDPFSKATCLWIFGLPLLQPTDYICGKVNQWVYHHSAAQRSHTFPGFARAMAEQYSEYLCNG